MHVPCYVFELLCPGGVGNGWPGIQYPKDTGASREAAHEPRDYKTEGACGRSQQEYILRDGYQFSKADLVSNDRNAAYPDDQHDNNIEYEHHQRLIPR